MHFSLIVLALIAIGHATFARVARDIEPIPPPVSEIVPSSSSPLPPMPEEVQQPPLVSGKPDAASPAKPVEVVPPSVEPPAFVTGQAIGESVPTDVPLMVPAPVPTNIVVVGDKPMGSDNSPSKPNVSLPKPKPNKPAAPVSNGDDGDDDDDTSEESDEDMKVK